MKNEEIKVVILAGGLGLRMREYTDTIPKALVKIGSLAVIEHVMKIYLHYKFENFILLTGYYGDKIESYFNNKKAAYKNARIEIVDTGMDTPTGGRLKKIENLITDDNFMATYCDGLADINLKKLYDYHLKNDKVATLTAVHPMSPFGIVEISDGKVTSFKEKPMLSGYINGGFFVFKNEIFDYLGKDSVLEEEPMHKLVEKGELAAYSHSGFWTCMDTFKDVKRLNDLWNTGTLTNFGIMPGKVPWKIWS